MRGTLTRQQPNRVVQARTPVASFSSKTGWRNQPLKRPQPAPQVADLEESASSESAPAGDGSDDAADEAPEDDVVLEHEQDDTEASGLIGQDLTEPNER